MVRVGARGFAIFFVSAPPSPPARTSYTSRSEKMIDLTMRSWAYFEQDHNFAEYQKMF